MTKVEALTQLYKEAEEDMQHWLRNYETGRNVNDLIAAAQKWGNMCGLAIAARMEGDDSLIKDRDSKSPAHVPVSV